MKISNKFQAISKLTTRYKLVEGTSKPLAINDEYIQPVTIADDLIRQPTILRDASTATVGTGGLNIYTIPIGKRYTIFAMTAGITANGTIDGVYLARDSSVTHYIEFYSATAANRLIVPMYNPIVMDAGNVIRVNLATRTGAGNGYLEIIYIEEDVY